ncbi:MAG: RNA polymerase sigma factor [Verrucomicrobiales bacterium]
MPNSPAHESRTELVQRALRDYEGGLVGYACSILGDPDRARDVVQDTFIRLWDQEPAKISENLKPWLYTVCRNRALDVLRRHKRVVELDELSLERQEETSPNPREKLANREAAGEILRFVDRLPANQREVIRLKFQADLSYKEIAELTGLSVTNVGFLLHTALKRLRTLLEPSRSSLTP